MLEFLGLCLLFLLVLPLALLGLVFLPLLLLVGLIKVALFLILLPFRILGAVLGLVCSVLTGVASVVGAVLLVGLGLLMVPMFPLLLVAGAIWLFVRLLRPRPAPLSASA